ncbi:uncharacterized protein LOC110857983 [Folsomia candida]|uniref:Fibroblast growth factor receptor 2 n=1 Tax=Folsomia candida TaxID=158441 RepID=A0A226DFL1_FOLCA|nr:uncharacterized protein LOC110857983 [Folsomia candida]OXA43969.1 Fibroblast growth factor receptor 2 [Folsomia candida]
MGKLFLFPIIILIIRVGVQVFAEITIVHVTSGQTAVKLSCPVTQPEPDKSFTSVLWLPDDDNENVIGAGAEYDHNKYRYLASTGQLLFKEEITPQDEGVYRCVLRSGSYVGSASVQVWVKRTYANFLERELQTNLIRGAVAAGLVCGTLVVTCLVYAFRHQGSTSGRTMGQRSGAYNLSPPPPLTMMGSSVTPGSSSNTTKTTKTTPSSEQETVALATRMEELILDPVTLPNNHFVISTRKQSAADDSDGDISFLSSLPGGGDKVPIASPESTGSTISIRVNGTPPEDAQGVKVKTLKPGSTIIYITASED